MTNILYRKNSNPTVPSSSSAKGSPLSNDEMDGNLKSISNHIDTVIGMTITNSTDINNVKSNLNTTNANVSSLESRVGNNVSSLQSGLAATNANVSSNTSSINTLNSNFRVYNTNSTFSGYQAGQQNTGSWNTANGFRSLFYNTTGYSNTALGIFSLNANTVGVSNTAVGVSSLLSNISGNYNTGTGQDSLHENTTGYSNTAIGAQSLYANDNGSNNTAVGLQSLYLNSTGNYNTAVGVGAGKNNNTTGLTAVGANSLNKNTTGTSNTAVGFNSMQENTTGSRNSAFGDGALYNNITGDWNTAHGFWSLINNTTGSNNTAVGYVALGNNTVGNNNTAVGVSAANKNTAGVDNVAIGANALELNQSGSRNVAIGFYAMHYSVDNSWNSAVGNLALLSLTNGSGNTAIGGGALMTATTSVHNTAIGNGAIQKLNSGQYNTAVGSGALVSMTTGDNNTSLGTSAGQSLTTASNNTFIGNNSGKLVTSGSSNVILGSNDGTSIATSNNNIILSDGSGNIRAQCNSDGVWTFSGQSQGSNRITHFSKSGTNHQSMIMDGILYTTSGSVTYANSGTGRGLNGTNIFWGLDNFQPVTFPVESPVKATGGNGYGVVWALLENNELYTWGQNPVGQCGLGHSIPVAFPQLSASNVQEVYSHPSNNERYADHSRLFYRSFNGNIYGCGYNANGALGIGGSGATAVPNWTQISIPGVTLTSTTPIKLFNLGSSWGCTVILCNNRIYVAGYNNCGQLGTGDAISRFSFTDVTSAWKTGGALYETQLATAKAAQQQTINSINAGIASIWSLAAAYGLSLGDGVGGTAIFTVTPEKYFYANYNTIYGDPNNFAPFKDAFYATGGPYYQTYGLADALRQQTDAVNALLASNTTGAGLITDIHATGGFGYYDPNAGDNASCSLMILIKESNSNFGYVRTCGINTWGQLGTGNTNTTYVPMTPEYPVAGDAYNIAELAVFGGGPATVYARTVDYKLYTWGYNGFNQLARNTTTVPNTKPDQAVIIVNNGSIIPLQCGKLHCDGLTSTTYSYYSQGYVCDVYGKLWSAGLNSSGYLGDGSTNPNGYGASSWLVKVILPAYEIVEEVGHYTTQSHGRIIILRTSIGNVYGWGYNSDNGLILGTGGAPYRAPALIKLPNLNQVNRTR